MLYGNAIGQTDSSQDTKRWHLHLGHASVNTTDIYAAADVGMLRAALAKTYAEPAGREVPVWADDEALLIQLTGLT